MKFFPPKMQCAVLFTALASTSQAGTLFVDASLTVGADDGSSWSNAYQGIDGLQIALSVAGAGDEVYVREGTYRASATGDRSASFFLENGVELYGGFLGTESDPSGRPLIGSAPTVLSGDLSGDDAMGLLDDNSYHVVNGSGADPTAILDSFIITSGNANGPALGQYSGGGLYCIGSGFGGPDGPTIRLCSFTNNRCTIFGGAVRTNSGSAPTFTDCEFINNTAGGSGGGVYIANCVGTKVDRCLFRGNQAQTVGAAYFSSAYELEFTNCLVVDNTATLGRCGGI